ncbi:DUF4199 domain-containing protein [Flaviaesturariibacter amylovorans]|uniref:DUF4199 domain-containing protein n=1 Tax=Flaviaesturariibacter amylovorans TaxID=1084520 RepID=A0ABP8GS73_9BACT
MPTVKPISQVVAGLIIAAAMIAAHIGIHVSGNFLNTTAVYLGYLPLPLGLLYFVRRHAHAQGTGATFGNLFAYGFRITAVVIVIMVIYAALFYTVLPQYKDRIMEASMKAQEFGNKQTIDDEAGTEKLARRDDHFIQWTVSFTLFRLLFIGALSSLLAAAVSPKHAKS